jgi:hypothetical protein
VGADAAVFLASDRAATITGAVIDLRAKLPSVRLPGHRSAFSTTAVYGQLVLRPTSGSTPGPSAAFAVVAVASYPTVLDLYTGYLICVRDHAPPPYASW